MTTSIRDLPPELLDDIIDLISQDKASLSRLCRTARFLLSPCQRRLFASVSLSITALSPPVSTKTDSFICLLRRSPYLASYTSHLSVSFVRVELSRADETRDRLAGLLSYFCNVRRFSIRCYFRNLPAQLFVPLAQILQLPRLVQVECDGIPLGILGNCSSSLEHLAFSDALQTISPVPNTLDTKAIDGVGPAPFQFGAQRLDSLLISLPSAVTLEGIFHEQFVREIDLSRLRKLAISVPLATREEAHGQVRKLLERSSASLEIFSFTPALLRASGEQSCEIIQLGICTSLRILHFRIWDLFTYGLSTEIEPTEWVATILEGIPILRKLTKIIISTDQSGPFKFTDRNSVEARHRHLDRIAKVCGHVRFPNLQKVIVHLDWSHKVMPSEVTLKKFEQSWLSSGFKPMKDSGILEISAGPNYRDILFAAHSNRRPE